MSNDLMLKKEDLLQTIEDKSLGDIIKPLVNEIHLFDTFIAGTTHLEDQSVLDEVSVGGDVLPHLRLTA